ncbi:hypothetical protein [Shewanella fidelis]|uniref:Uncharacterized protein n=2 Tax=Shewanellaceae TaxID=267890 RepID=A0AAW8NP17_9GAMM|nr:hypothetical protein [Shewanella fidelis]MDR8524938.1 hypothetical protein [Shewanella fidelis]MDW4811009.1 hypothetical protein [Shewanella fidelis]MDW4823020.1 hypothetical protein [Shewanella fidelis]
MLIFAAELLFTILWDYVLCYVLYATGAVVLYFTTWGKVNYPLAPATVLSHSRRKAKSTDLPFLVGLGFYLLLFTIAIWLA